MRVRIECGCRCVCDSEAMLMRHTSKTDCSQRYKKYVGGILVVNPDIEEGWLNNNDAVEGDAMGNNEGANKGSESVRAKMARLYNNAVMGE